MDVLKELKIVKDNEYRVREIEENYQKKGNMYDKLLSWDEPNKKYIPIICGHGGSMWLCFRCYNKMIKE